MSCYYLATRRAVYNGSLRRESLQECPCAVGLLGVVCANIMVPQCVETQVAGMSVRRHRTGCELRVKEARAKRRSNDIHPMCTLARVVGCLRRDYGLLTELADEAFARSVT